MSIINIIEAVTPRDISEFIEFPYPLYAGDPFWVPPLRLDVKEKLSPKHPFWIHSEKKLFLARDEMGKTVGRIAAIIDSNFIKFHGRKTGYFGFYESINDALVCAALTGACEKWLREKGMTDVIGPMNPSTNYECGFLLEGYDSSPFIMMTYNPPFYHDLFGISGYSKAKDLLAFFMFAKDGPMGRLEKVAGKVRDREPDIRVRPVDMKDFASEAETIKNLYNSAWEKNWGFVPMTDAEFDDMAKTLKMLVDPKVLLVAESKGKPVGFIMALPDYNQLFKTMNGRLFPFGILKLLFLKKRINQARLILLGIKEEFRGRGLDSLLYYEVIKNGKQRGYHQGEFSWVLEDNVLTIRASEMLGGRVYKKYRIYGKQLA